MKNKEITMNILFISSLLLTMLLIFFGVYSYFFDIKDYTIIAGVIAFAGAIIGGALTLLGVKVTLNKQEETRKIEKEHQRYLFFSHLRRMYFRIDTLLKDRSDIDKNTWAFADSISIVPNWEERLLYLDNLEKNEMLVIFNWLSDYDEEFKISPRLENHKESEDPALVDYDKNIKTISVLAVYNIFNKYKDKINIIIEKYHEEASD